MCVRACVRARARACESVCLRTRVAVFCGIYKSTDTHTRESKDKTTRAAADNQMLSHVHGAIYGRSSVHTKLIPRCAEGVMKIVNIMRLKYHSTRTVYYT